MLKVEIFPTKRSSISSKIATKQNKKRGVVISICALFLLSFINIPSYGQDLIEGEEVGEVEKKNPLRAVVELNFDTWFDNREYKSLYAVDQTLFGALLTPIVGLNWREDHNLMIGGDFRAEFGTKSFSKKPEFILYYNYNSDKFKAYAGVFPRRKMMGDYPNVFVSDSIKYYDSNLDGALFQYIGESGYVELACDWFSMISDSQREKFVLYSSGEYRNRNGKFFAGYYLSMFHYSVSYTEEGVIDNFLVYPYAGVKFTKSQYYDRKNYRQLLFKVGWVQAMQRDRRSESGWDTPGGMQFEFNYERWRVGVNNTLYVGKNLMPHYEKYGTGLYIGDPFYRTKDILNKTEIYWNPVRSRDIDLQVGWSQIYDGKKWSSQQLIRLSINLNRGFKF